MSQNKGVPPRVVPSREEKYMGLAFWVASFSKDPNTQHGAVIISSDNVPIATGYNGPARGIKDSAISWARPDKYDYIVHAEENAIANASRSVNGATVFVTGKPCAKCMLSMVNHDIKEVIYFPYKSLDKNSMHSDGRIGEKTDEIAKLGNVDLTKFKGNLNWMRDRIQFMFEAGVFG